MKTSELIEILEQGIRAYGDKEVLVDLIGSEEPIDGVLFDDNLEAFVVSQDKDLYEALGDKSETKYGGQQNPHIGSRVDKFFREMDIE